MSYLLILSKSVRRAERPAFPTRPRSFGRDSGVFHAPKSSQRLFSAVATVVGATVAADPTGFFDPIS